ncbi:hypothetical protein SAMD00019534_020050 [Acytostelium subglobosum LB1]|uniref:hypothetical protein n=1 Tax=Acytostelium subglobosum LB1 TaxID=1410327 RepID=UPI000644C53F|nr:hypothetical protein SAMD00019534_020050 [Acytostelium subglobosum LB1]GAM18830.1 hypothetical protein SAMD00019534_020050 [Acytostelium subglobosum LB1]|eukprot:XP_012758050.1 hypothetical protein SAMD00019534_020050 [Acytostelium subglobosum LB1]
MPIGDDSYNEGGSLYYYSDIPLKREILHEKYRHWARRILFYLALGYFITATIMFPFLITNLTFWFWLIHVLWFELDLTTNKNNIFIQLLHAVSFVGSWIVMVTATILLVILNPDFIAQRAHEEHHSVAFAWLLNVWVHYIPPILLTLDMFVFKEHIRKRHHIILSREHNTNRRMWVQDVLKVVWAYLAPIGIVGIWLGAGFTIQVVYGVTNFSYNYLVPIMVGTDIIFATLFLYLVRRRNDNYIKL